MLDAFKKELVDSGSVRFYVRAVPGAASTGIAQVMADDTVKIRLAAPAEGGKANAELIRFLAKEFRIHWEQVQIISGQTSRQKLVSITQSS